MNKVSLMLFPLPLLLLACGPSSSGTSATLNPVPAVGGSRWGGPSTITGAQLQACPLGDSSTKGTVPASVVACLQGTFNGVTKAEGGSISCSLTVGPAGELAFSSPALTYRKNITAPTSVNLRHSTNNGTHNLNYRLADFNVGGVTASAVEFSYLEGNDASPLLPNVFITAYDGNNTATCYAKI